MPMPTSVDALPFNLVDDPGDFRAVYFLFDGSEVVYIGASSVPRFRATHGHRDKKFDRIGYLQCGMSTLYFTERYWIEKLKPKYNVHHNPDAKIDSIRIDVMATAEWKDVMNRHADSISLDLATFVRTACEEKFANDQRRFPSAD